MIATRKPLIISIYLMVLAVIPKFYDLINLPRLIYLSLILIITFYGLLNLNEPVKKFIGRNWILFLPLLGYLIISIASNNSWQFNLIGSYQRNNGIIAYAGLTLLCVYLANSPDNFLKNIAKHSGLALIIFSVYCLFQFFELDFLPWNNPYNRIIGSVGNPNFSAALLGILIVSLFIFTEKRQNYFIYFLILSISILSVLTESLQGPLIGVISLTVYATVKYFQKYSKLFYFLWSVIIIILSLIILSISNVFSISRINLLILKTGSGENRLDYWLAGIRMFKAHPIFGVGPNSYQQYFGEFRNLRQVIRDGANIKPDQAHSVLIEMFADGGLILGLAWTLFAYFVTYRIIKSLKNNESNRNLLGIFSAIWIGYLTQSLISIDNLTLTFFGYVGAGGVIALTNSKNEIEKSKRDLSIVKIMSIAPAIALILYVGNQALLDYKLNKIIRSNQSTALDYDNFSKKSRNAQTDVMIANFLQQHGDFKTALNVATRGADRAPRFTDNLFLKGVSQASLGNPELGIRSIERALDFDPLNTFYMVKLANLQIDVKDFSGAKLTIEKIYKYKPTEAGFSELINKVNLKK